MNLSNIFTASHVLPSSLRNIRWNFFFLVLQSLSKELFPELLSSDPQFSGMLEFNSAPQQRATSFRS